jgi:hypothetical protein
MVPVSEREKETLVCELCGASAKSVAGLKIHKGQLHKDVLAEAGYVPVNKPKKKKKEVSEEPVVLSEQQATIDPEIFEEAANRVSEEPVQEPPPIDPGVRLYDTTVEGVKDSIDSEALEQVAKKILEEPVQEPVQEPVNVPPTPPAPKPLNPAELGIREILEGSRLRLTGPHFVYDTLTEVVSGPEHADGVLVVVNKRWLSEPHAKIYLKARSEGGSQEWVIEEGDVLSCTNVELLSFGKKVVPINYVPEVPASDGEVEEGPSEEEIKEQENYLEALNKYKEARDAKLAAEKEFKAIDGENRHIILDYLQKVGTESSEGSGDNVLLLEGVKAHWTFSPGKVYVKKDEEKIVEFLLKNCMIPAIKYTVDWDMWGKLKEKGMVPAEFIQEVEVPQENSPVRKLLVEIDTTEEEPS